MAKIATLVHYCTECDRYFASSVDWCTMCGKGLEGRAVVNLNELARVMQGLQTPQGVVNLLESFKTWVER